MASRNGRRDPAKERFWRKAIQRQGRSGLSIREFCDRENLKPGAFSWWRRELAKRDRERQALNPDQKTETSFVPVQVVPDSLQPQTPPAIEIVFPSGPTVRVPSDFDAQALKGVLEVLESRSC